MKKKEEKKIKDVGILIDIDINHHTGNIELCVSISDPDWTIPDGHRAETKNVFKIGETNLDEMLNIAKRNIRTQMEFFGHEYIKENKI